MGVRAGDLTRRLLRIESAAGVDRYNVPMFPASGLSERSGVTFDVPASNLHGPCLSSGHTTTVR
jgi:hypothetical protein